MKLTVQICDSRPSLEILRHELQRARRLQDLRYMHFVHRCQTPYCVRQIFFRHAVPVDLLHRLSSSDSNLLFLRCWQTAKGWWRWSTWWRRSASIRPHNETASRRDNTAFGHQYIVLWISVARGFQSVLAKLLQEWQRWEPSCSFL